MKIKDLPVNERPYEKALNQGIASLSDAELLAVILRCGSHNEQSIDLARKILNIRNCNEGLNSLNHLSMRELMSVSGIGRVKALMLLSVVEISRRMSRSTLGRTVVFSEPKQIADYYMQEMRHLESEELRCIYLDSKKGLITGEVVFKGTVNKAISEPREILKTALKVNAVSIVLLHNHPSGDPKESSSDISTTYRIRDCARLLGVELLDHIIIGDNTYTSFKEKSLL